MAYYMVAKVTLGSLVKKHKEYEADVFTVCLIVCPLNYTLHLHAHPLSVKHFYSQLHCYMKLLNTQYKHCMHHVQEGCMSFV